MAGTGDRLEQAVGIEVKARELEAQGCDKACDTSRNNRTELRKFHRGWCRWGGVKF